MPTDRRRSDLAALSLLLDPDTVRRGARYAFQGNVVSHEWVVRDVQVWGEVAGTAPSPYTASVTVRRDPGGQLTRFEGTCTCPMRADCKHTVALLLAADEDSADAAGVRGAPMAAPAVPARPEPVRQWELSLRPLLDEPVSPRASTPLGLQFEVIDPRYDRNPRTGVQSGGRIALRPVAPGASGKWIRSGVSWRALQYPTAGPGPRPDHAQLFREIAALEPFHFASYYGHGANPPIWLDTIPSPRIWHLLQEAERLGVAFVPHRGTGEIRLLTDPAEIVIEVTRDAGLLVTPVVTVAGREVPAESAVVVGQPPHGVVVLGDGDPSGLGVPGSPPALLLAPLSGPVDEVTAGLVSRHRLRIPAGDEDRFLSRYYPVLRRKVTVVAADDSVQLPQPEPPQLVLRVAVQAEELLELSWRWRYRVGSAVRDEPLHPPPAWQPASDLRDEEHEAVVRKSVESVVGESMGDLLEMRAETDRLAAVSLLSGMPSVRFVTDVLPVLRALPGVEVEIDGQLPDYREVEGEVVVSIAGEDDPADSDWFDLLVTVEVGGHRVPFAALFAALALGQDYVVFDDGFWLPLLDEQFTRLGRLIQEARDLNEAEPAEDGLRLSRYQTDMWAELEELGVISGQAAEWQAAVRALRDAGTIEPPPIPTGLRAELRPYQRSGFAWLAFLHDHRLGGVLADDMGLGKTLQAIALILHAKASGVDRPFLVVAPTSVVFNWAAECERFAPDLRVATITETTRRRRVPIAEVAAGADVVVTSYALLRLDEAEYAERRWAGLILDEAQFVKNRMSRGYASARRVPADFRLAVTGTPLENNLMELWSLLSITAPGLFPDPKRFEAHYRKPIESGRDPELLAQLRRRVAPLMLRRTKQEVASELPDKVEQVVELPLNAKQRKIYDIHLARERQKVLGLLDDMDRNRFEIFRSLTLLRQLALAAGLIDPEYAGVPSTKLDALMEQLVEIVEEGHRVLVFSQFTRFLEQARQQVEAAGIASCYLDGTTKRRAEVIERFRSGDAPVFLISLKAGGFGLNLTEADYCILLDPWWNPAAEAQAIDRTHRIGQTRTVMVYRLVSKDTIEEKVMALKARKAALFASVMSEGGTGDAALTADDIRSILQ